METRRALFRRAWAGTALVALGATTAFLGAAPARADHPAHDDDICRGYPSYPGSPNPWIKVVAEDNTFDTNCLRAPANRNWRIYLQNNDPDPHNISIYSADPAVDKKAEQLYKGEAVKGPGQVEYAIEGLPPGKYYFQDDKTKTMNGAIEVDKPKK